jgi:hypothetical protein
LNNSLRETYGVDLTASREEIVNAKVRRAERERQEEVSAEAGTARERKKATVQEKDDVPRKQNGSDASDKDADAIADIKGQLFRFYIAWNVFDPPAVGPLAKAYFHRLDELNGRLRMKYHGTDLTWTPEQIGKHVESLEANEKSKADEMAAEKAADRRLETAEAGLSAFYKAWGVSRNDEDIRKLAGECCNEPEAFNRKLQGKYHGTDLSWSASELEGKVRSIKREEFRKKEQEQQLQARAAQLEEVCEKLQKFYAAWSLEHSDSDIRRDAAKCIDGPDAFNSTLQSLYHGTDLSWKLQDVFSKVRKVKNEAMLNALVEQLAPFYTFWGADDANSRARSAASTYSEDIVGLKKHLRATYHGNSYCRSPPSI